MTRSLGGIIAILPFVVIAMMISERKKKLNKQRYKNSACTKYEEEYHKELLSAKKHIEANLYETMPEHKKEIQHYLSTAPTKYGNYYENILKKYRKRCPISMDQVMRYSEEFYNAYKKSTDNLAKKVQRLTTTNEKTAH